MDGAKPFSGFSKAKRALDKAIAEIREREGREPMPPWRLHDLRRTARTLVSRAGVSADHAERCLGHIIGGVRGVYDRHAYHAEKKSAFDLVVHEMVSRTGAANEHVRGLFATRDRAMSNDHTFGPRITVR
jgi:integrase